MCALQILLKQGPRRNWHTRRNLSNYNCTVRPQPCSNPLNPSKPFKPLSPSVLSTALVLTLKAYLASCAAGEGSSTSIATRPSTLPSANAGEPLKAATQRVWYLRLLSRGG
eukprot:GHRQ01018006.1.p2 GENE.GHRQ01018006.1~~GHRQ01018006.1.p2  ORF type:complete len:111 (-),score=1.92 GHRQ01018006.1:38-370(-)